MSSSTFNEARRSFFLRAVKRDPAEAARLDSELRAAQRLQEWERVYESELRAFGPDLLVETALSAGSTGADYVDVAKTLAQGFENTDHEK